MSEPQVEVYGIRHHGPGSARALRRALEEFKPEIVLIEGPPEADAIVPLAADPTMVPPVALLAYVPPTPKAPERRAAFWPFAEFSPEWQAIRHALSTGAPVRFCDLPATHQLATPPNPSPTPPDTPNPEAAATPAQGTDPGASDAPPATDEAGQGARVSAATPAQGTDPGASGAPPATDEAGQGARVSAATPAQGTDPGASGAPPATDEAGQDPGAGVSAAAPAQGTGPGGSGAPPALGEVGPDPDAGAGVSAAEAVRVDPLGWLAEAAGYDDAERWWDDVVEHRGEGPSPFAAIEEAMTALRQELAPELERLPASYTLREEQREAYMRRTLRQVLKEGYERVAVVCGAWHVPAIRAKVPAGRDDKTLRGLPKAKVELTWVPWTHGRLASWSGYGAGVTSPGWYHHLFTSPTDPIERWLTEAARLLREEDLPVSSAHVIEAVRLADTLAALRDRPLPGLDEVTEATRAVLCEGAELPLELIQRRMVVGERLGSVPDDTPMVPLQRDLQAEQRRLKFKPAATSKDYDLDLRKPGDLDRSRLLHRLRLLDIAWGTPVESGRTKGTFRESWTVAWRPEFDVDLIEAGAWGTTVHDAATAKAITFAQALTTSTAPEAGRSQPGTVSGDRALPELTSLAERCLLADLASALPHVMQALADRAAADTDVVHLMAALPPLVRALRYGDVRGTPTGPLRTVVDGLVTRIRVGLPPAVTGLDDDAARLLLKRLDDVNAALALLDTDNPEPGTHAPATTTEAEGLGAGAAAGSHLAGWQDTLAGLVDRPGLHGLIEGRLTRVLRDAGRLDPVAGAPGSVAVRMARAVSIGEPPARAAAWIEGFLAGGGLVLVHDEELLRLVDGWIAGLSEQSFTDVLPLLRRSFSEYAPPERRSIGERVRHLDSAHPQPTDPADALDPARAAQAARTVLAILQAQPDPAEPDPAQPDPAQPDQAQPDQAQPDQAQPDPAQPDQGQLDQAQLDGAGPEEGRSDEERSDGASAARGHADREW